MGIRISRHVVVLAGILTSFFVSIVSAGTTYDQVLMQTTSISTSGGPFKVTVQPGSSIGIYGPGATFTTFCVEVHEGFYNNTKYYALASNESVYGEGSSKQVNAANDAGGTGYVPLAPEVAYLYTHFMNSTMKSQVDSAWGGNTDAHSAQSLQNAIWYFMGYQIAAPADGSKPNSGYVDGSWTLTHDLEVAASNAVSSHSWVGLGDVRVMQLWTSPTVRQEGDPNSEVSGTKSQDQLVLVPTPTASMAGLSLLGGLGLVGWIKRRRNVLD